MGQFKVIKSAAEYAGAKKRMEELDRGGSSERNDERDELNKSIGEWEKANPAHKIPPVEPNKNPDATRAAAEDANKKSVDTNKPSPR